MDNFNLNKDKINKLVNETSPIPSTSRSFFDSLKPSSTTQSSLPAQEALRRKLLFNHPTPGTSRTSYFGGAANSSLTASARARRLSSLTPYSLQSRQQTPVHRIEPKRLKKNDGEYQTESDRILKMLEKASTPINDAKKMPIYHSEFNNLLSDLRLLKGNNLKIPKTPRITPTEIIINHKTPPLKWDLTLPLKKDDDKNKVAGDDVNEKDTDLYGKNVNEGGGKIMASKRQTDKITEDNDVVVLPKATLEIPQGTTLPKFNFGLNQPAKPSSTTTKSTSITAAATVTISNQLCKKCRNKVADDDNDDDKQGNNDDNCDSRFSFSLPNIKVRKRKTESSQTISNTSKKFKINQSQNSNSNSEKLLTSKETSSSKVSNQNFLVPNILLTNKFQKQKIFFGQSENKVETSSSLSKSNSTLSSSTSNWGDKFKLTSDKWSCPCCMLYNENSLAYCPSCNEPNPNKSKVETPKVEDQKKNETIKQVPKPIAEPLVKANDKSSSQLKWRCDTCLVMNEPCDRKCIACDTIRLSNEKIVDNTNYKFDFSNLEQKNSIFKTNLSSSALTTAPSTQSTVTSSSFFQLPTAATTTASSSTSTFASLFQSSPVTTTSQSQVPATTPSTFTFGSPSTTTSSLFHSQTASPATTTTSLFQSQVPTITSSSSSFSLKPITTSSTSLFQFGQATTTTTTTTTTSSVSTFQSPPTTSSASTNLFQPPANPSSASGFQLPSAPSTTTSRFQFGATATTTSSDQFGINTTTTTTASSIKYPPIISLPSTTSSSSTTNLFQTKTSTPQTQSTSFQLPSSTTTTTTTTATSPIFQFGQSSSTSFPIKPLATTTTTTTSATAFPIPTAGIQNSGTNLFAPATTASSNPFQLQVTSSSTFGSNTFGTNSFQSPPTTTTTSSFGSNTTFSFGGGGGGGTATTGSSSSIAPFTFGGNTSVFPQQPAAGFTNSFNGGEQFKFGNNSFQSNILQNNNPLANPTPAQPSIQPFGVKTQVQPQANLQFNLNPTSFNFASSTNSFGQNGQDSQLFQFSAAADPQQRGQNPSRIIKKARRRLQ